MELNTNIQGGKAVIKLLGRFDFNSLKKFALAYQNILSGGAVSCLSVDFGKVDHIDSSALGILIQANEACKAQNCSMELTGVQGKAKRVFELANLQHIFSIHST